MSKQALGSLCGALLTLAAGLGCSPMSDVRDIGQSEWRDLIATPGPRVVYIWASWSRPSVELLPTIIELEEEFEPLGVDFRYVSLDADSAEEALALMREIDGPQLLRLTLPLEQAVALVGIHEVPAVIGLASDGRRLALEAGMEGTAVTGEDAAVLIEDLVTHDLKVD